MADLRRNVIASAAKQSRATRVALDCFVAATRLLAMTCWLSFVFERERHARAEGGDLAVVDRDIHPRDLGDAQVTQRSCRGLDRPSGCVLPGLRAHPDHVDDPVNAAALAAFRHG